MMRKTIRICLGLAAMFGILAFKTGGTPSGNIPSEQDLSGQSHSDFVLISDVIPDVLLEIRYFSTYNFIGDRIPGYEEPVAILTRQAADSLKMVSDELKSQGYILKIFDAYRPQCAVDYFMKWAADISDTRMKDFFYPEIDKAAIIPEGFVAKKSGHTRGSTVDLTLFDMTLGRDVDMGCTFDYFGEASYPLIKPGQKIGAYKPISEEQASNRMILRNAMLRHGFKPYENEWWHFTLKDEPFPDTYFNFPVKTESVTKTSLPKDKYDFIFLSDDYLQTVEKRVQDNPDLPAFKMLIHLSDSLLDVAPKSVMDKDPVPPSGDKHDFMSMGIYWWPNPDTPDGLPYIRKDGQTNPEIKKITDSGNFSKTYKAVETLSLAYRYTGDEKYAAKAAELLRVWFLNPDTRMNPNMNYAQGIPGVCDGRGTGIIDLSLRMPFIFDPVIILESSKSWTKKDDRAFRGWVKQFAQWLTTSEYGIYERSQKNNHGTNYDVLVLASYLFLGEKEAAAEFAREWSYDRFDQIAADGSQPRELERTSGWSYVMNNTRALLNLAKASEKAGVDYWSYVNPSGASLQTAMDWIAPYVAEGKEWDYQDIKNVFHKRNVDDIMCFSYGHLSLDKFRPVINSTDKDNKLIFLMRELE